MSKLTLRPTPVNGYDVLALTQWLEEMAAEGYLFSLTFGMLTQFDRIAPTPLRYHLEPARKGDQAEQAEIKALFEQDGWQFLGTFRGNFYVFATEDQDTQAYTEPELYGQALDRLAHFIRLKLLGLSGLLLLLGYLIYQRFSSWSFVFQLRPSPLYTITTDYRPLFLLPLFAAVVFQLISMLRGLSPLYRLLHTLNQGRVPTYSSKKFRGGGWLKVSWLCLLLVPLFWAFQVRSNYSLPLDEFSAKYGYVQLTDLETAPGFSTGSHMVAYNHAASSSHVLVPQIYYSREYGDYNIKKETTRLESGVTVTSYSNFRYYLETHFLRCLTPGIADIIFDEQHHWAYFQEGTELAYPGFDRLIVQEDKGPGFVLPDEMEVSVNGVSLGDDTNSDPRELNRWHIYAQKGKSLLFIDYMGSADLTEELPRFAHMLETL